MKKYSFDGEVYDLKEVQREYVSVCSECLHYGESAPTWESYIAEFEEVDE